MALLLFGARNIERLWQFRHTTRWHNDCARSCSRYSWKITLLRWHYTNLLESIDLLCQYLCKQLITIVQILWLPLCIASSWRSGSRRNFCNYLAYISVKNWIFQNAGCCRRTKISWIHYKIILYVYAVGRNWRFFVTNW